MRNFESLMNDMEVRRNLVNLKNCEESVMVRRCCKFETVTYFKVGSVGKNQRMYAWWWRAIDTFSVKEGPSKPFRI